MKKIAFPAALSLAILGAALLALPSCRAAEDDSESSEAQLAENEFPSLNAQPVMKGAPIVQPTTIVQEPGDNDFFYVLEKAGRVLRIPNKDSVDSSDVQVALDIRDQVASGDTEKVTFEEGLLNMIFHPKFRENQQVFVYYNHGTSQADLFVRLSRFKLANGKLSGEVVLIDQKKDRGNHNGGGMVFDKEGLLYLGVGDGGQPNDPNGRGQDKKVLLGKVLRLDVDREQKGKHYAIPKGNPFATGELGAPEIFSYGHRNPWRMAIDDNGTIFEAEVGQELVEEVNVLKAGGNYGWSAKEGSRVLKGDLTDRLNGLGEKLIDPVAEYGHEEGQSITGGLVYRGTDPKLAKLKGRYIFGDFAKGTLWALIPQGNGFRRELVGQTGRKMSSFGEDQAGNLFLVDHNAGAAFKLVAGAPIAPPDPNLATHYFLSRDGVGTRDTAQAYYKSIGADDTLTVNSWLDEHVGPASNRINTLYQNVGDLGFWRQMTCSKDGISAGKGGCAVTNWNSPDDADVEKGSPNAKGGAKNLGTVTMNVSKEGFTRFYVFTPDGKLSPIAILDFEGEKAAPNLCTTCHGGAYAGSPDMGAMFREFEPSWLKVRPGVTQEAQEKEWFTLNQIIRKANLSLRTSNPDDQLGYNKTVAYIDALYPTGAAPATAIDSPQHIPAVWSKTEKNPLLTATRKTLWTTTVGKYCMQCHRSNTEDFASYSLFEKMGLINEDGFSEMEHYIGTKGEELFASEKSGKDKNDAKRAFLQRRGKQFMPNANVTRNLLLGDPAVLPAIQQWIIQAQDQNRATVKVTFQIETGNITSPGEDLYVVGSLRQLGLEGGEDFNGKAKPVGEKWNITSGIKLTGSTLGNGRLLWSGSAYLPYGAQFRWKTFIMSARGELVRWQCDAPVQPFKDSAGGTIADFFDSAIPAAAPTLDALRPDNATTAIRVNANSFDNRFHVNGEDGGGCN
jgi:glucose/arabinose dehydrogenase